MLKINHTICPRCSIGCGINLISKDGFIVGINPYKNHEINEGKNCKNCIDYINQLSAININEFDYSDSIEKIKDKLKNTDNKKVSIITSGNCDDTALDSIIKYSQENDYNLMTYEYNFTKASDELIASYDDVEESEQIVTIGDIYRNNSLIARRIIHAQENDAYTVNIYTEDNLTAYNSNQFIKIDSYEEVPSLLESMDFKDSAIIIINQIDSSKNYEKILSFVKEKNIKILPLLKHPNSYSVLEKTTPSSLEQITNAVKESELLIFINESPKDYLDESLLDDKEIITFTENNSDIGLRIPIRLWCQKQASFTNSMGTTQRCQDAIEDSKNNLKSVEEILELI